jgi:TRAP-type uncharacterized transport system substrate-binding protein
MLRALLIFLTIMLGATAAVLVAGYFVLQPTIWRVVIPASDQTSRQVFEAAADLFKNQRKPIRLQVETTTDTAAAIAKLERGEAQLAVTRAQDALHAKAQSVLVLRQETAVLLTPKKSKIKKLQDIVGAEIAVVREGPGDPGSFAAVLDYYKLDRAKIKVQMVSLEELPSVIRRIDVLAVVGAPASKLVTDAINVARGARGELRFIDIDQAEVIAKRVPALDAVEIKKGSFGGRPPYPDDDFNTIGFSVRVLATEAIAQDTMSDFLHQILSDHQILAQSVSAARTLKIADTDDEDFVAHQGVVAYGDGEVKSFFDRYSDQIYVGTLIASGIGSAFAALIGWLTSWRRTKVMSSIFCIEEVLDSVPNAKCKADIDALEQKADQIFRRALSMAVKGEIDSAGIAAFEMALIDARARLHQRRSDLTAQAVPEAAPAAPAATGQLIPFTQQASTPGNPAG